MPEIDQLPRCLDCGLLDYNEVLSDPTDGRLYCGLCGEDLPPGEPHEQREGP